MLLCNTQVLQPGSEISCAHKLNPEFDCEALEEGVKVTQPTLDGPASDDGRPSRLVGPGGEIALTTITVDPSQNTAGVHNQSRNFIFYVQSSCACTSQMMARMCAEAHSLADR